MTNQIEPQCLNALIEKDAVKVVDGSWALDGTDMRALYTNEHIPGAVFFDLEAISDHSTSLPHMAPTSAMFAQAVGAMGIGADDHVVIYDRQGLFSAARVWWTFKLMGHQKVQVLRGGLPAWKAQKLPVTATSPTPVPTIYKPEFASNKIITLEDLSQRIEAKGPFLILDARPAARFFGQAPEPRTGLRSGHMPGARSLPFAELLENGALKPREALRAIFDNLELVADQTVITTCGSGVTAAIISMALDEIGHTQAILYDGSWAEWGQSTLSTPVTTDGA